MKDIQSFSWYGLSQRLLNELCWRIDYNVDEVFVSIVSKRLRPKRSEVSFSTLVDITISKDVLKILGIQNAAQKRICNYL